jgi:hypothetical protein
MPLHMHVWNTCACSMRLDAVTLHVHAPAGAKLWLDNELKRVELLKLRLSRDGKEGEADGKVCCVCECESTCVWELRILRGCT